MRKSKVDLANDEVSILEACRQIDLRVPDDLVLGKSVKVHCPQGDINHPDGGTDPTMRVYPHTSSAWCFVCQMYFTPVKMVSIGNNISYEEAAAVLLNAINYSENIKLDVDILTESPQPDNDSLAEALKVFCRRSSVDWETRQFTEVVSGQLQKCFDLLGLVRNSNESEQWLSASKQAMMRVLEQNRIPI